jgi:hypothetical protein
MKLSNALAINMIATEDVHHRNLILPLKLLEGKYFGGEISVIKLLCLNFQFEIY